VLASIADTGTNGFGLKCSTLTPVGVMWQTIIHVVFILSAIGIAWTDRLMQNGTHRSREAH